MRTLSTRTVVVSLLLLASASAWAQTTGRITGTITDNTGAPMPGVAVTVSSPSLQGVRSATTASDGEFRFLALPPGNYSLKAEISGFKSVEQKDLVVGIDRTVTLPIRMAVAGVAETVEVSGESPVVDTNNTTTGINATADLFGRIPLQRTFDDVARVAPGTQQDASGTVVYGSSGAENQYIIEGLNTTGVRSGTLTKQLNFDFVDEVEVKTGGMPAEYGRLTGGALNILTKSGSNNFHGSAFGFFEGKGLASSDTTGPDQPAWRTTTQKLDQKYDFGASLGGYVVKDTLWFFGAYNRVNQTDNTTVIRELTAPGSPAVNSVIPTTTKSDLFSGKLTWKLSANHTINASVFGDPHTVDGYLDSLFPVLSGPSSTWQGTLDEGGTDYVGRYDGVFSNSFMVRAQYGRHKEKSIPGGAGRNIAQLLDQTVTPTAASGGFGFFSDETYTRDQARLDLSKFLGTHEIRLGGDWQKINDDVNNYQGGAGQRIYQLPLAEGGVYYRHRYYVDDQAPGYNRNDPTTWQIALPQISKPNTQGYSAYLQDSWKVVKNFTLNLGVRWEQQDVRNRFGASAFKISDNWAPRAGFVWDVRGNGNSKLFAHYGRYYEDIPQDINIRSFGGEVVCFCYNFSSSASNLLPDPNARRSTLLGGPEAVDPNLKGQFINEYIGGYEQEVAPNFSLGVKATYRSLGRVIEDFLVPSEGSYFIANPGEGTLGQTLAFYDQVHTAAAPKAARKDLAFEVNARKRFSNNWQLLASYVWEKLDGNYDGTFQNSTGQLDPNINSAFDYADFLVNANGRLSAERQNQVKLDGSYQFRGALDGLNIGVSAFWYSGLPLTAYGYSLAYANWEYYLTPRGSLGRGPSDWEANLHLNYPIRIGQRGTKLDLVADIFNVFNRQSIIQLDQRYNLIADGACAGIPDALCNGDGGLATSGDNLTPIGQLTNPRATATNPDFLKKGTLFTLPRSIRLGMRLTF